MTKEETQIISFKVISYASEALDAYKKAVVAASEFKFELSEELAKQGNDSLTKAHQEQTNLVHAEVNGLNIPFSIILIHSQDHLMNAMLYQNSVNDQIRIYRKIHEISNS